MEIVYCSKCEKQIPPGGLHEGRYFVVGDEAVCLDCYEELPDNIREGSIQLFVPEANRKRTTALPGYRPPSDRDEAPEPEHDPEPAGFKAYAGWAVAFIAIVAVAVILMVRGC
jgi:hypothetical protein